MTASAVSAEPVLLERHGAVLVITLDRPEARNAIDLRTAQAIGAAVETLESDRSLAAGVIAANGPTFCAGMDLKAHLRGERPRTETGGFAGLVEAPPTKPLIAAVEGSALGGGFEIVLACDLVVASTPASFGLPEVKRGLVAAAGGLTRLPVSLPRAVALEMILTGDSFPAADLAKFGLVNRLVEPGQALATAVDLALRIAENGPLAVHTSKRVVVESVDWPPDEEFARLREAAALVFASADAREGARAFAERRQPAWSGS
ncbi:MULTISPECIES: crotonase/enoyl-CoA hydratase family protein [unclassified Nocardioides]|uniref:crotonase/enoyl-CoA hydratase family protein n=1 Tax=unclassified Nocardioides TaxID=2615069 RepID=UPI0006FB1B49|nr:MULTISPECIES: crotonase/enoyl-CoA hydratase family protein [unclassified Nocardioides]KQY57325.1 enoyl-CoA hydratase [Nocardioides sp. Root140]KQZ68840.1 enoyl-CoA hydratase [Nocardioides sp. Root151]KRF20482.1 enoyl-CoA hydratase [Nocardioides sp. Soil796]